MKLRNKSGEVQVLFCGNTKMRFGIDEEIVFGDGTGSFLLNEFSSVLELVNSASVTREDFVQEDSRVLLTEKKAKKINKKRN